MPKPTLSNPRGAGRKPTGADALNMRVSVFREDREAFKALPNKAEFVRNAIAEKLKEETMAEQKYRLKPLLWKCSGPKDGVKKFWARPTDRPNRYDRYDIRYCFYGKWRWTYKDEFGDTTEEIECDSVAECKRQAEAHWAEQFSDVLEVV